jgi:hypothetical protein
MNATEPPILSGRNTRRSRRWESVSGAAAGTPEAGQALGVIIMSAAEHRPCLNATQGALAF